ncbi:MAG: DNA polymerase I [Proteobacteria bacterium]|nr:DNA polymerase I [Desulfobulbaceae bacterium]MBU4153687.1 DNA polymerase I [Pseudomonadota bacterium]
MTHSDPIYLIDGNAYIHRGYHAIPPLANKQGLPTNATFGFTNILLRVLRDKAPRYLAVAFDAKGPTFRHHLYDKYKANRPPMPNDLAVQLPSIKAIVEAYRILTLEQSGVEADDLIATCAHNLANQGHQVIIVSGDKDLLQLVSDTITLWDPMQDRVMDAAAVQAKYKVPAAKLTDLFALIGDSSDNIPGVAGIGPKTAEQLINEFSSLDGIFEHLDAVKRPKLRDTLKANREAAFLSRDLIVLNKETPVPTAIEAYLLPEPNSEELTRLFTELEFSRLLSEHKEIKPLSTEHFHLVGNSDKLTAMVNSLKHTPYLIIDTETTGLDTLTAELVGISLCGAGEEAWYLPISHQDETGTACPNQLPLTQIKAALDALLTNPKLPKIGHNLKFDYAILANHQIKLCGPLWDTMIASYLVDPTRRSHKLDSLCAELLDIKMTSFSEVTGASKFPDCFRFVAIEMAKDYSCEDAIASAKLWRHFEPQLDSLKLWPLFNHVETPLIPILAGMERSGILIDSGQLLTLSSELGSQIKTLEDRIRSIAGPFNINSPKQLAEILFETLGLPHGRKTKTGYSTDSAVLEKLSTIHELPRLIIEHRNISKLKSTYVDKLPTMVHPRTGRLHTSFNQAVTATGRLSSSEPNLQNIPIRTPEGQRIRAAFISAPGCRFLAADYSQIDLRVLAHYSKDPALVHAFCTGDDIHRQTAAEIFGIDPQRVTGDMRRVAKSINFGIVYGMSAFGLSEQLRISRKEAATFIDRYFAHFSGVKTFMDTIINQARVDGFVTTLLGRRRDLPDINSPNKTMREFAERTALNTPIQGTAADIIKLATIKVHQDLVAHGLNSQILLQIHDELIIETPTEEIEQTTTLVKAAMEQALDLNVPLLVNIAASDNLAKI